MKVVGLSSYDFFLYWIGTWYDGYGYGGCAGPFFHYWSEIDGYAGDFIKCPMFINIIVPHIIKLVISLSCNVYLLAMTTRFRVLIVLL